MRMTDVESSLFIRLCTFLIIASFKNKYPDEKDLNSTDIRERVLKMANTICGKSISEHLKDREKVEKEIMDMTNEIKADYKSFIESYKELEYENISAKV